MTVKMENQNGRKTEISLTPLAAWKSGLGIRAFLVCAGLCLAGLAMGQFSSSTVRLEKIPDPVDAPSLAAIDVLEADANAGDWALKQQFAAAYLYEHLKLEYWNWGCSHLPHGHVCRAMASRSESGERFLREVINLRNTGPVDINTLARFQSDFAHRRLLDARPEFSSQHPACQDAVHYYEKAIENELAYWGNSCAARTMAYMASYGQCMPKDSEKSSEFFKKSGSCATE